MTAGLVLLGLLGVFALMFNAWLTHRDRKAAIDRMLASLKWHAEHVDPIPPAVAERIRRRVAEEAARMEGER